MSVERDGVSGAEVEAGAIRSRDDVDGALRVLGDIVSDLPTGGRRSAGQMALGMLSIADSCWRFHARPATPGDGAAGLAGDVERLRARFGLSATQTDAQVVGWALGALVDAEGRVTAAEKRATAAEARAEAVERERDAARASREHQRTERRRNTVRGVITWLHERADKMRDPHARSILHATAHELGFINAVDKASPAALAAPQPSGGGSSAIHGQNIPVSYFKSSADPGEPGRAQEDAP